MRKTKITKRELDGKIKINRKKRIFKTRKLRSLILTTVTFRYLFLKSDWLKTGLSLMIAWLRLFIRELCSLNLVEIMATRTCLYIGKRVSPQKLKNPSCRSTKLTPSPRLIRLKMKSDLVTKISETK